MCFDIVAAVLSAATVGVGQYMQVQAQNQAQVQQYKYQQQMQTATDNAAISQYNAQVSLNHQQQMQQANTAAINNQQQVLQNQRAQASAVASAATGGITGQPLQSLFNSYQVSMGNIASNLQNTYDNLNANLFYGNDNARLQAQSTINRAVPAVPYMAKFSALPALVSGLSAGFANGKSATNAGTSSSSAATNPFLGDPEAGNSMMEALA